MISKLAHNIASRLMGHYRADADLEEQIQKVLDTIQSHVDYTHEEPEKQELPALWRAEIWDEDPVLVVAHGLEAALELFRAVAPEGAEFTKVEQVQIVFGEGRVCGASIHGATTCVMER